MLEHGLSSNRLFEEAQSLAQVGIWSLDLATNAHYWSNEMYRLLGLDPSVQSGSGSDALKYIHPDDLGDVMWALEAASNHAIPFDIEHRVILEGGEQRYVQSRCRCIAGPGGEPQVLIGTLTDITARKRAEQESARLAAIVESSDEAIASMTLDCKIVSWNRAAEELYGYAASELIGRHASILSPYDPGFIKTAVTRILQGQALHNIEMLRKRKNGEEFDASLTMSPIKNDLGEVIAIAVMIRDITERKIAEAALRRSEMQLQEAQRIARVGSWELDVYTKHITWSAEMYRIMGLDPLKEMPSLEQIRSRYHPQDLKMHRDRIEDAIDSGRPLDYDLRIYDDERRVRWCHVAGHAVQDSAGKVVRLVGAMVDITDRKENEEELKAYNIALQHKKSELEAANAKLEALATLDGLTGLNNHRAFQERLAFEYERARRYNLPLALVLIDVDFFKQYNDEFGHPAGDEVLKSVAQIMQGLARQTDIVGRYGGEEFVVILPQTDSVGAMVSAERIRKHIEKHRWKRRSVTVSIGVCCVQPATKSPTDLLSCADQALYSSKRAGRNHVTCDNGATPGGCSEPAAQAEKALLAA